MFNGLIKAFVNRDRNSPINYYVSFLVEQKFWENTLKVSGLDSELNECLETILLSKSRLFVDWTLSRCNIEGENSGQELVALYKSILSMNYHDETSSVLLLQHRLGQLLESVHFQDLSALLSLLPLKRINNPVDAERLMKYCARIDFQSSSLTLNSRGIYEHPKSQIRVEARHLQGPTEARLKMASELSRVLEQMSTGTEEPERLVSAKAVLETSLFLLDDYHPLYKTVLGSLHEGLTPFIKDMYRNELLLMIRLQLTWKLRDPSHLIPEGLLADLARAFLGSNHGYSKALLCTSFSSLQSKVLDTPSLTPLRQFVSAQYTFRKSSTTGEEQSNSQAAVENLVKSLGCTMTSGKTILNLYSPDFLLSDGTVIEVNGNFHYTTRLQKRLKSSPWQDEDMVTVITKEQSPEERSRLLEGLRAGDLIRYNVMADHGHRVVAVNAMGLADGGADRMAQLLKQALNI